MLWAVLIPLATWWILRRQRTRIRLPVVVLIAILAVPASGALGSGWLVLRVSADSQATTDTFAPACFPFTMVGYHDLDAQLFNYSIVLGWPNGIPVVVLPTLDDQSEYMAVDRLTCGVILTQLAFLAAVMALLGILALEAGTTLWKRSTSRKPTLDAPI